MNIEVMQLKLDPHFLIIYISAEMTMMPEKLRTGLLSNRRQLIIFEKCTRIGKFKVETRLGQD